MRQERFNRSRIERTPAGMRWTGEPEIMATPGMLNASLQDAVMYGGDVVRDALSSCPLVGNRKHTIVDVKVHMLMEGMVPAIPGWHTDGVPRHESGSPSGPLLPDLSRQENRNSPVHHLLVAGCDAPTVFVENRDVLLDVPCEATSDLYAHVTKAMNSRDDLTRMEIPMGEWWTWDWWELHSAQPSREKGWRVLIRVTESDFVKPKDDLRDVIRTHQQAYIQGEFGW